MSMRLCAKREGFSRIHRNVLYGLLPLLYNIMHTILLKKAAILRIRRLGIAKILNRSFIGNGLHDFIQEGIQGFRTHIFHNFHFNVNRLCAVISGDI